MNNKTIEIYRGKGFSVLGDSVSTLDGYTRPVGAAFYEGAQRLESGVLLPENTWWGRVIDALGGELVANNSISGSMVSRHPKCCVPSYGCSDERTSDLASRERLPDVIMVFLGINDWGCGTPPVGEGDDISTFSIAYKVMLEKLKANYPEAEILCLTLPICDCDDGTEAFSLNARRYRIEEYNEIILGLAKDMGCRALDIRCVSGRYPTIDGYHPNAEGMEVIADAVLRGI